MYSRIKEQLQDVGIDLKDSDLDLVIKLFVKDASNAILNSDEEEHEPNNPFFSGVVRGKLDSCHIIREHFGLQ